MKMRNSIGQISGLFLAIIPLLSILTQTGGNQSSIATAATQLPTPESITVSPTIYAQNSRARRLQFEPGTTSTVVEDSVVRGTRDTYLLRANRRQTITVSISSVEDNAVFDIIGPNGRSLSREARNYSGVLPATGDYRVVVGGTRGNATYTLEVEIK